MRYGRAMKPSVIGGGIGAVLGAIVAVVAHFTSQTLAQSASLPHTYADYFPTGSQDPNIDYSVPVVRESWWPVLPMSIVVGLAVGAIAGLLYRRHGSKLQAVLRDRPTGYSLPAAGAALGGVIAVIAHFSAHALPSTYFSGTYLQEGTSTVHSMGYTPTARPPWLWSLPISVAVGLLLGLAAAALLRRSTVSREPVPA